MSMDMDRKVSRPGWRRPGVLAGAGALAVALVLVLAIVALLGGGKRTLRVPLQAVTVDTVQAGTFHDLTPLRGKVAPHDTIYLDALEGGQVAKVMAHGGDMVRAGQPLLTFRNTELELDVLDREGRLVESITQLQTYEKTLEDARLANDKAAADIDYNITRLARASDRRRDLVAAGYVAAETGDQLRDELDYYTRLKPLQARTNARQDTLRREQLPEIVGDLANLKTSLAVTRGKLASLTVTAPVTGQLTDLVQNVGENHNRGDRLGEIVPNTGFKVTASIDEYYLGRVRTGQVAQVTINDQPVRLRVERVYPEVKDGVFTVDLAFDGAPPPGLLPGQAVDGSLSLGGDQPALVLPAGAFLERTGGDWVMVLAGDGRSAERRQIRIGRRNTEQVEVLGGLKPGDRVITSDYTGFEKVDRLDLTR